MTHFLSGKTNIDRALPRTSYKPGVHPTLFQEWLPPFVYERLKSAMLRFGQKARGYITDEAVLLGVETRTSSPIRIPRESERMTHPVISGLFPCGEGAGYAGGIISAAMDGEACADAVSG
jgi:uncharacterized FAD-dependent dehydrogenase